MLNATSFHAFHLQKWRHSWWGEWKCLPVLIYPSVQKSLQKGECDWMRTFVWNPKYMISNMAPSGERHREKRGQSLPGSGGSSSILLVPESSGSNDPPAGEIKRLNYSTNLGNGGYTNLLMLRLVIRWNSYNILKWSMSKFRTDIHNFYLKYSI